MREVALTHQWVEYIPNDLEDGVLYVSLSFATVVHKCCCGCGREVVTPLSPTDWRLTFDGETISLFPSIGNWSFPCQSHYWIECNTAQWARRWSKGEIAAGRASEALAKRRYYDDTQSLASGGGEPGDPRAGTSERSDGPWQRLMRWLSRRGRGSDGR